MAATTIGALSYQIIADTTRFDKGMSLTRSEIAATKKIMHDSIPAAEKMGLAIQRVDSLHAKGAINARQHAHAIDMLNREYREMASVGGGGFTGDALSLAAPRLAMIATPAGAAAAAIGAVVAAGAGLGYVGASAVKLAADFEQAEVSFRTMLGSATAAKDVLRDLQGFAAETPFGFPDVTDAATKLVSFRVEQEKLIPTLKALGDLSAGLRIPLGELSDIYGRQKSQGRVFAQDLNQFTGRGIPLIQEFAKQFGVADMEVRKLVEEGKIGFENLEEAIVSMTSEGGQFHDLAKEQSKTLSGLAAILTDEVTLALTDLGKSIAEDLDLKEITRGAIELAGVFRDDVVPAISTGLGVVGDSIRYVQIGIVELQRQWAEFTGNEALADAAEATIERLKRASEEVAKKDAAGSVDPTHDPLAQDFAATLVNLERQRDTIGKSKLEVELMQAAQKGFNAEQLASIEGVLREIDAKEKLIALERQAANEKKKLANETAAAERKAAADRAKLLEAEQRDLQSSADRILESIKSPGQKLGEELFQIQQAMDAGLISQEEGFLASSKLNKDFGGQFRGNRERTNIAGGALERGSAEAFSAILRGADKGKDKQTELQEKELRVAEQTFEVLKAGADRPPVVVNVVEG